VVCEVALAEGRAISLEEATEYALSGEETDPPTISVAEQLPASTQAVSLTRREQEVALLVAEELTNRRSPLS
jgi:DNA-binding NarL/FixJ family response regulator